MIRKVGAESFLSVSSTAPEGGLRALRTNYIVEEGPTGKSRLGTQLVLTSERL